VNLSGTRTTIYSGEKEVPIKLESVNILLIIKMSLIYPPEAMSAAGLGMEADPLQ